MNALDLVDAHDQRITTGELVTYLNDALLFAPSMLWLENDGSGSCLALCMIPSESNVGPIERFMVEDHARIDRLLQTATQADPIDELTYGRFRHDLLRHIAMEEKVLLPFAREKNGGTALPIARALRADHGEIAKLLVRSPTRPLVEALREVLGRHNPLEEGPSGLYARCDALAGDDAGTVVALLREQPNVPVAKYYDGPLHRRA